MSRDWQRALILTLVFFGSSAPRMVYAQPDVVSSAATDDRVKGEAKEHFLRGVSYTTRQRWDAAYAEFVASRELYPTRVAVQNAALCLREMGRFVEALDTYETLLRNFAAFIPVDERTQIDQWVVEMRASIGTIELDVDPSPTSIVIDGEERGAAAKSIRVNPGLHSVRLYRDGFQPFGSHVVVASRQSPRVRAVLLPLVQSGRLLVAEVEGRVLDVVLDGSVVGKTPWSGSLALGTHAVALRGDGRLGSPPSSATVVADRATSLTLRASALDSEVRIEPTPSSARIDVDGVTVGNGVWGGRLLDGPHRFEVTAEGFLPYRADVTLEPRRRENLLIRLERLPEKEVAESYRPRVSLEASLGLSLAPGLGGSADGACARGACSSAPWAAGFVTGARGGYELARGLSVELLIGYMVLSRTVTRSTQGGGEQGQAFTSTDERDAIALSGPVGMVSASYHTATRLPLLFRIAIGAARVRVRASNEGHFEGPVTNRAVPGDVVTVSGDLTIPERSEATWIPLVAPEVRLGYPLGAHVVVDVGIALMIGLAPATSRTGAAASVEGQRRGPLPDVAHGFHDGSDIRPGFLTLPSEVSTGTFFALVPSVAARYEF